VKVKSEMGIAREAKKQTKWQITNQVSKGSVPMMQKD
jgi:hypothetical protein